MKTDTIRSSEDTLIMDKINRMILETGEHPFVFKNAGKPVFVSFPPEAEFYFTANELCRLEYLLITGLEEQPGNTKENGSLSEKLAAAKLTAAEEKTINPLRRLIEKNKNPEL